MSMSADILWPKSATAKEFRTFAVLTISDENHSTVKVFCETMAQAKAMADAFNAHQPKPATDEAAA